MNYKWIGAFLVILACGGCGFSMAASYRAEENIYRNLIRLLVYMSAELQYRLTALPELCEKAANESTGIIRNIFHNLSKELQTQISPDAASCMRTVIGKEKELPSDVRKILLECGQVLGRFDLEGQVRGIEAIKSACEQGLEKLNNHREERLRGYQTLGLCAGAALVILFI